MPTKISIDENGNAKITYLTELSDSVHDCKVEGTITVNDKTMLGYASVVDFKLLDAQGNNIDAGSGWYYQYGENTGDFCVYINDTYWPGEYNLIVFVSVYTGVVSTQTVPIALLQ